MMLDKQNGQVISKPVAYDQLVPRLLHVGETLLGETQGVFARLAQEIDQVTHGQAQLVLQEGTAEQSPFATPHCIPVKFNSRSYGELWIALDPADQLSPAIPWTIAFPLARLCGWLLYTIEVTALLPELRQPYALAYKARISLPERAADILVLICQGYTTQQIATRLDIAPATVRKYRERLYRWLDVHSKREAVFAAFAAGLFYPVADLRPQMLSPTNGH